MGTSITGTSGVGIGTGIACSSASVSSTRGRSSSSMVVTKEAFFQDGKVKIQPWVAAFRASASACSSSGVGRGFSSLSSGASRGPTAGCGEDSASYPNAKRATSLSSACSASSARIQSPPKVCQVVVFVGSSGKPAADSDCTSVIRRPTREPRKPPALIGVFGSRPCGRFWISKPAPSASRRPSCRTSPAAPSRLTRAMRSRAMSSTSVCNHSLVWRGQRSLA